jgi:hypothetical protein
MERSATLRVQAGTPYQPVVKALTPRMHRRGISCARNIWNRPESRPKYPTRNTRQISPFLFDNSALIGIVDPADAVNILDRISNVFYLH